MTRKIPTLTGSIILIAIASLLLYFMADALSGRRHDVRIERIIAAGQAGGPGQGLETPPPGVSMSQGLPHLAPPPAVPSPGPARDSAP